MLPTPNINFDAIPEACKNLGEGSHHRLYTFSPADCGEMLGNWRRGETDLPGEGMPQSGKIHDLTSTAAAVMTGYSPEKMLQIAQQLYTNAR